MVRNHQDGYPYLNLAYIFQTPKFLWYKLLVNEFCDTKDAGLLEIFQKYFFYFQTSTKNPYKTKNAGKGQEKFVIKSLPSKVSTHLNFIDKLFWSMNSGTPRARDY